MHVCLLAVLAFAADSNALSPAPVVDRSTPAGESWRDEAVAGDLLMPDIEQIDAMPGLPGSWQPLSVATGWPWFRARQAKRPLLPRYPANQDYHQSHGYDPRLMLDYPWHAPRVRGWMCPTVPPAGLPTAF